MSAQPVEVRQCPKCQQAAVTLVMEWQHTTGSIETGQVTKEYRCQQCGGWQVLPPRLRLISFYIVGGILSVTTCVLGIPFFYLAWRQKNFEKRVPLVSGAPVPRLRFPGGPPRRTCGKCGGVARALNITRHTHRGIPTGTEYGYECGQCKLTFTTENVLGHVTSTLTALAILGFAAGFLVLAKSPGWKWGGGLVALAAGLFMLWNAASAVVNRFKHAPIEEHVL